MFGRSRSALLSRGASLRAQRSPRRNKLPAAFVRRIVARICSQMFVILLVMEGVFLIEKLNSILDMGIDRRASLLEIVRLLLFSTPEIFDLALPGALLIGIYRVFLRAREDNELIVVSSMGIGMHQFIPVGMLFVAAVQCVGLSVSGFVGPWAHYAYRRTLFEAQYQALRAGGEPGQIDYFVDNVVYYFTSPLSGSHPRILIHQARPDGGTRVILAQSATLHEPNPGQLLLQLDKLSAVDVHERHEIAADGTMAYRSSFDSTSQVRVFSKSVELDQLLPFESWRNVPAEWAFGGDRGTAGTARREFDPRWSSELLRRIGRSLLCIEVAVLAMLALTVASQGIEAFVLPGVFALSLGSDVLFGSISHYVGAQSFWLGLISMVAVMCATIGVAFSILQVRYRLLLKPSL